MATTITRATLGNKASIFIRDVLRENLTDTQSPARSGNAWIFKSEPQYLELTYPRVILEGFTGSSENLTFDRSKGSQPEVRFNMMVWSDKIADRDSISDEIVSILRDNTNTDGTDTIKSKGLWYLDEISTNIDIRVSNTPDIIRRKRITMTFKYTGA